MSEQGRSVTRVDRGRDTGLRGTEAKAAFKTTEFIVFLATVAAVLIADYVLTNSFGPSDAWRYVTYLAIGYMVSRGLAKSGSRNPRPEDE